MHWFKISTRNCGRLVYLRHECNCCELLCAVALNRHLGNGPHHVSRVCLALNYWLSRILLVSHSRQSPRKPNRQLQNHIICALCKELASALILNEINGSFCRSLLKPFHNPLSRTVRICFRDTCRSVTEERMFCVWRGLDMLYGEHE